MLVIAAYLNFSNWVALKEFMTSKKLAAGGLEEKQNQLEARNEIYFFADRGGGGKFILRCYRIRE